MGLRDELQAEIAEAFDEDLAATPFMLLRVKELLAQAGTQKRIHLKILLINTMVVAFCLALTTNIRFKPLEY